MLIRHRKGKDFKPGKRLQILNRTTVLTIWYASAQLCTSVYVYIATYCGNSF